MTFLFVSFLCAWMFFSLVLFDLTRRLEVETTIATVLVRLCIVVVFSCPFVAPYMISKLEKFLLEM